MKKINTAATETMRTNMAASLGPGDPRYRVVGEISSSLAYTIRGVLGSVKGKHERRIASHRLSAARSPDAVSASWKTRFASVSGGATKSVDLPQPGGDLVPTGGRWGRHERCNIGHASEQPPDRSFPFRAIRSRLWGKPESAQR